MYSTITGTVKALKKKATDLLLEHNAILVLANHKDRKSPQELDSILVSIHAQNSARWLKQRIVELRSNIFKMRADFGVRGSQEELLNMMIWMVGNCQPAQSLFVPAGELSKYLAYYERLPFRAHTRVSIDVNCIEKDHSRGLETRLLEASLYEDMCALFNLAHEGNIDVGRTKISNSLDYKIKVKRHAALMRGAASAAFYFVEAYINGLATDFLHSSTVAITDDDRMRLTEWNPTKKRHSNISTRDKLVHYPRILTGAKSPPIQENNCAALAYFVTVAKSFRDAIVHASASIDPKQEDTVKERLFFTLTQDDVAQIIDASITVVRTIESLVHGKAQEWLVDRNEDGFFDERVFQ